MVVGAAAVVVVVLLVFVLVVGVLARVLGGTAPDVTSVSYV